MIKKTISLIIAWALSLSVAFGQYLKIQGGDQEVKMFCPQTLTIIYDTETYPETPQWAIIALDFNPNEINLQASDFNFSSLFQQGGVEPSLVAGVLGAWSRLFAQRGANTGWLPGNGDIWTLSFSSKRTDDTVFSFYVVWQGFTDGWWDTDLYYGAGEDMLVYASGATFSFTTGTCSPDAVNPQFDNFSPNIFSNRTINYWNRSRTPLAQVPIKISEDAGFSFEVKDGDSLTKNQPWYVAGTYPNLDINNYRANLAGPEVYSPFNVADRASGIDPNSLKFSFSNTPTLFTQNNIFLSPIHGLTRERRDRDYQVQVASNEINEFPVEEEIIFSWYVEEFSSKNVQVTKSFNAPVNPWITNIEPFHQSEMALPLTDIKLRVRDDRSGIDSGSLVLTVLSGSATLAVFSGADLHLEAVNGDADSPDFWIHIYSGTNYAGQSFKLPIPLTKFVKNTITVQVDVSDQKWNSPNNPHDRREFYTRYSCGSYTWCQDPLSIYIRQDSGRVENVYLDLDLYVTGAVGTDMPNLDLLWKSLDCGDEAPIIYTGISITWQFVDNPGIFTGDKLYFEGADVVISGDVIIFGDF